MDATVIYYNIRTERTGREGIGRPEMALGGNMVALDSRRSRSLAVGVCPWQGIP